jgi:SET and MYND domain-containing protein 4
VRNYCNYFIRSQKCLFFRSFDFIGALIYHNLQVMQFNAHEISELQYKDKKDCGTSTFIGGGIYTTVAFFNHSCDPGVVRYFNGNVMMLRAIKPIAEGEMVAENYGPIFTQTSKDARQEQLLKQYHFNCMCKPCMENWPTFKEMDDSYLRFRCDGLDRTCKNVLKVPIDVNEFMIQCTECGEHTNIMKGLKSLQDTDMLFKTATRLHEAGDTKQALPKYVETLDLLDQSLVPPFRTYHLTQQGIKRCITEFGNKVYL